MEEKLNNNTENIDEQNEDKSILRSGGMLNFFIMFFGFIAVLTALALLVKTLMD